MQLAAVKDVPLAIIVHKESTVAKVLPHVLDLLVGHQLMVQANPPKSHDPKVFAIDQATEEGNSSGRSRVRVDHYAHPCLHEYVYCQDTERVGDAFMAVDIESDHGNWLTRRVTAAKYFSKHMFRNSAR